MPNIQTNNQIITPAKTGWNISRDIVLLVIISVLGGGLLLFLSSQSVNGLLSIIRLFLGIIIIGLLPGFLCTLALFPKEQMINALERLGISLVLNLSILALIGYGLNYTIWGLTYTTIIITITIFNIALCLVVFLQRRNQKDQPYILALMTPNWKRKLIDRPRRSTMVFMLSAIIIVVILIMLTLIAPTNQESYTEFFLLEHQGLGSITETYSVGEFINADLVIINHENRAVIYHIIYVDPDRKYSRIASVLLSDQEKIEQKIAIELLQPGINQEIQFLLFREGEGEPHRSLQLWITVLNASKE